MRSDKQAEEVMDQSGLYLPKPGNTMHSFEGIPNQGTIFAVPDAYDGHFNIGMVVLFNDDTPQVFKHDGHKLFTVDISKIVAEVNHDVK